MDIFDQITEQPKDVFDEVSEPKDVFDTIEPKVTAGEQFGLEFGMKTAPTALEKVPLAGGLVSMFNKATYSEAKQRIESGLEYPQRRTTLIDKTSILMNRPPNVSAEEAISGMEFDEDGRRIVPVTREEDEEMVRSYERRMYQDRTWGATVAKGVSVLPTYVTEFAITADLYKKGKLIVGAGAKSSTLKKLFGWIVGSEFRTVGMLPRAAEQIAERKMQVEFGMRPEESPATTILKGWNTVLVGNMSEVAGGNLTKYGGKVLSKLPFGRVLVPALKKSWIKMTGGTSAEFARRLLSVGGYSNILGEFGEEELETVLHAITNNEDFGAGKNASMAERIWAGLKQDFTISNLSSTFAVLSIPILASRIAGKFNKQAVEEIKKVEEKPEPPTVDVMKSNVEKHGKEKLQTEFEKWKISEEGQAEKESLGLPEDAKFLEASLWETFNRQLYDVTPENIQEKLLKQLDEVQDLRKTVAEPALKELHQKQARQYQDILNSETEKGTSPELAQARATAGMREKSDVPDITPPKLTSMERDFLFSRNTELNESAFDIKATHTALTDWMNGKILAPHQFTYLWDVIGNKAASKLWYKQRGLKKAGILDFLKTMLYLPKLPFSYDVQFNRQATAFKWRHPILYRTNQYRAIRAYINDTYSQKIMKETEADPYFKDGMEHNVPFLSTKPFIKMGEEMAEPEQFAFSHLMTEKLLKAKGKLGKPFRAMGKALIGSERSMVTACNRFMKDLYKLRVQGWEKQLQEGKVTAEQMDLYKNNFGQTLQIFMKLLRSKNPDARKILQASNWVLYSPSMTYSRILQPTLFVGMEKGKIGNFPVLKPKLANEGNRAYAAGVLATEIGSIFLFSGLVTMMGLLLAKKYKWARKEDGSPLITSSLDPTSTKWGGITIGDVHKDYGGGDVQHYRAIVRMIMGEMKNQAGVVKKVPRKDVLIQYASSRETAIIGVMSQILTGRNFVGEKVWEIPDWDNFTQEHKGPLAENYAKTMKVLLRNPVDRGTYLATKFILQNTLPEMVGDIFQAGLDVGWASMLTTGVEDFMSTNVQIYPETASIKMQKEQEKAAQIEYQKDWGKLSPLQQKKLMGKYPLISEWKQQSKFERSEKDYELSIKPKQIKLDSKVKSLFKKYKVPYPAVSRNIGGDFFLNDERFKDYQELVKTLIEDKIAYITGTPGWGTLSEKQRQQRIQQEVDLMKKRARTRMLYMFELEK